MSSDDLVRTIVVLLAVILLAPILLMAVAFPMMGWWGAGHMWDGGMWNGAGGTWMWALGWLIPLAIVIGIGYLLYAVVQRPAGEGTDPALEELRTAYARGDISDEEFEQRRERLRRE